jgi:tetratricopeptide (TPR) repeat protein
MASTRQRPKIRRKDLKQPDEFMTVAFSVEEFVEQHLIKAIAAIVTVLIVAAALFAVYQHRVSVKSQAAEQFYEGFSALNSKDYKGAGQKFDALIADHPTLEAAHLARFYRALAYLGAGDLTRAREGLEDYAQGAVAPSMHELALMDLGVVYEQTGDYAKAAQAYRRAGDLNGPESANAHLAVARVLQVEGKRDAAIAAYQDFLKANPYAAQRDTVVQALANLGVSVPGSPNISMPPAP